MLEKQKQTKLFTNGRLIDIETGETFVVDIEVENEKIKNIVPAGKNSKFSGIDLAENFVLPNFVNVFCDSYHAFENNFASLENADERTLENVRNLMTIKNILAGASCNDINQNKKSFVLSGIADLEENQLATYSDFVAKNGLKLSIVAGQTLEELGSVDKMYKKPLSQVLEDFGFLDRQPCIVGGNCFEKDDLQLFGQYGCDFCLTVDAKFGKRPTNLVALKMQDFCVGLGSCYNFEIDFFAFMRQILMTQRSLFEDENCVSEQDVLKIATYFGSKILTGEENAIKVGSSADFIVVRNAETLYDDILKTIVWEKSKHDVLMTVKNGEILQKNGKILMKNMADCDTIIHELNEFKEKQQ